MYERQVKERIRDDLLRSPQDRMSVAQQIAWQIVMECCFIICIGFFIVSFSMLINNLFYIIGGIIAAACLFSNGICPLYKEFIKNLAVMRMLTNTIDNESKSEALTN